MLEEVFFITSSEAELNGRSLGSPVRVDANPTIGNVPLTTRSTFVLGQVHMLTTDPEGYRRIREEAHWSSDSNQMQPTPSAGE